MVVKRSYNSLIYVGIILRYEVRLSPLTKEKRYI
jgi:hypothetical protein